MSNNNFGDCWVRCHMPSLTNQDSFSKCFRQCIEGASGGCTKKPITKQKKRTAKNCGCQ